MYGTGRAGDWTGARRETDQRLDRPCSDLVSAGGRAPQRSDEADYEHTPELQHPHVDEAEIPDDLALLRDDDDEPNPRGQPLDRQHG